MGASRAGSYEVTPPGRSRASDAAHRADGSTQRQQPTRQAYGESDPTGDATLILTGLRHGDWFRLVGLAPGQGAAHDVVEKLVADRVVLEDDPKNEWTQELSRDLARVSWRVYLALGCGCV